MSETYCTDVAFDDDNVIHTTVTSSGDHVELFLAEVHDRHSHRLHLLIVGLDIEWRPNFQRGGDMNPVAVLQLCVGHRCLVFQVLHADYVPAALKDFLADPGFRFVGVGIESDAERLLDEYDLAVANAVDLRGAAADALGRPELRQAGLQAMALAVMGARLVKPRRVTMSRWDARDLSWEQVSYACIDAFVSFEVGRRLLSGEY